MKNFRKKAFSLRDISKEDNGISVESVIKLVSDNDFYPSLAKLLKVEEITNEFINIPGAKKLVDSIKAQNSEYEKFDLKSNYNDLVFKKGEDESFLIQFTNIQDPKALTVTGKDNFTAELVYSSKSDFFESAFGMDKYASTLTSKGYNELVYKNLEMLRDIFKGKRAHEKHYRILKSTDGKYYLRAIVSSQYNDYNNNITVFLGLIVLHQEMKKSGVKFAISRCEYNESFVRIFFEKLDQRLIQNLGSMKYIIELSNDEIRREALRFSGAASIIYGEGNASDEGIFIKPSNLRSDLSAISHALTPEKAIERLASLSNYVEREKEMYEDTKTIGDIKSPDEVRSFIENKVRNLKQNELRQYTDKILKELNQRVNSLHDLFVILNKIDFVVSDIEAKEYLRYLLYEGLIERKGRFDNK